MSNALEQAERIVDRLTDDEREQLKRYIDTPQASHGKVDKELSDEAAWQAYREAGRRIAELPSVGSLTEEISRMRR